MNCSRLNKFKYHTSLLSPVEPIALMGLYGGIGGLTRATVGMLKALRRGEPFIPLYYLLTGLIAWILGVFSGSIFGSDWRVALLAGYAGTDLIESAIKAIKKTNRLFSKTRA